MVFESPKQISRTPSDDPIPAKVVAKKLLPKDGVPDVLKSQPLNLVRKTTEMGRDLGNSSFKRREYEEAETYYTQAIVGYAYLEDGEGLKLTLSNRAASLLSRQVYENAILDAETCLMLDPKFDKGWYRLGRGLYGIGRFEEADDCFYKGWAVAGSGPVKKEMEKWRGKAKESIERREARKRRRERILEERKAAREKAKRDRLLKAKLIERATVDYSKFDDALAEADALEPEPKERRNPALGSMDEDLTVETPDGKSMSIESFLNGGVGAAAAALKGSDPNESRDPIVYRNDMLHETLSVDELKSKFGSRPEALPSTIERLSQLSSCHVPVRIASYLDDDFAPNDDDDARPSLRTFVRALRQTLDSPECAAKRHCLALGGGTGVPLVTAARHRNWKDGVTCIPSHHSPILDNLYRELLVKNGIEMRRVRPDPEEREASRGRDVTPHAHVFGGGAPPERLSFDVDRYLKDNEDDDDDEEKRSMMNRIPPRADLVIVDPDLFDAGLLGHGVLPTIRHARTELAVVAPPRGSSEGSGDDDDRRRRRPTFFPRAARVFAQPAYISTPPFDGLNLKEMDKYRWSPGYEESDLGSDFENESFEPMGPPLLAFEFDFEGENLEASMPPEETVDLVFTIRRPDSYVNAIAFWHDLDLTKGWIASNRPMDSDDGMSEPSPGRKQAVQYIDPVKVPYGDEQLVVEASHTPTRIKFRVDPAVHGSGGGSIVREGAIPRWHFAMMADGARNGPFRDAIVRAVEFMKAKRADKGGRVNVLDYGSGSGLLSLLAAKAGATSVIGIEHVEHVAQSARRVAIDNGYGDAVRYIAKDIRKVTCGKPDRDVSKKQDVLVMELFDHGFLGEGALHFAHHAWKRCLKSDAVIVPARARVYAVLVQLGRRELDGIDLSPWGTQRYNVDYYGVDLPNTRHVKLSDVFEAHSFDFSRKTMKDLKDPAAVCTWNGAVPIVRTGVFNAVVWWFEMDLTDDITFSTAPDAPKSCWMQACQTMEELTVDEGDVLHLTSQHQGSCIAFGIDQTKMTKEEYLALRTDVLLWDEYRRRTEENLRQREGQWLQILSSPDTKKSAVDALVEVCADPGKYGGALGGHVDVQHAQWAVWQAFLTTTPSPSPAATTEDGPPAAGR